MKSYTVFCKSEIEDLDVWPGDTVKIMTKGSRDSYALIDVYEMDRDGDLVRVGTRAVA
jgi:hypothetical protein